MTYEEFKRELCQNVQAMETARNKKIRLLEQHMVSADAAAAHMLNLMNRYLYGRENVWIREDMLCALWTTDTEEKIQYWLAQPLYERYGQEGWQGILPEISAGLEDTGEEKELLLTEERLSYATCRSHMIMRPINFDRHRQELGAAVYRKIGDMVLVLYLLTCEKNQSSFAIQLSKDAITTWRMTEKQLITEALMNACRKMPPRLFLGDDRRAHFPYAEGILLPEEKGQQTLITPWNSTEAKKGYLLTTTERIHGAAAFFYPGVKDILAEKLGGDYYVVFPSLHEAMIHPVSCSNAREIRTSLQHINAVYGEGEMLSDRVFCYHKNRRLLQLL